ncbi:MAG TPA: metalloregulator ArsR/SmtB family transcription factor [Xanthobacteraceae bacterium]|jgi:DNA-binding transcriptional ArsR family regulator
MPQAMRKQDVAMGSFEQKAAEATRLLKLLANENRLLILCRLVAEREMPVGEIAAAVGLSQSALSQHLAKMREEGLVATRREAQTIHYRIADPDTRRILAVLKSIYCP